MGIEEVEKLEQTRALLSSHRHRSGLKSGIGIKVSTCLELNDQSRGQIRVDEAGNPVMSASTWETSQLDSQVFSQAVGVFGWSRFRQMIRGLFGRQIIQFYGL